MAQANLNSSWMPVYVCGMHAYPLTWKLILLRCFYKKKTLAILCPDSDQFSFFGYIKVMISYINEALIDLMFALTA